MRNRFSRALATLNLILCGQGAYAAAVGHTIGTYNLSPAGSAQYTISLRTPPGVRGLQPTLSLVYDSQTGYGIMGPGWNLSGLSSIYRCTPTYVQDGTPAPITLTYADRFCMDGKRLRLTSSETLSTYGAASTTYQTEIADFSNVVASSTLAGDGPSYFTVSALNGWTYEYGNTTDSKILPCSSGCATPYVWALDKITDRAGNVMTFTYTQTSGAYVITNIGYGSNDVAFGYSTLVAPNSNITSNYIASSQTLQSAQLSTIATSVDGNIVQQYNLNYTASSTTGRATLTTIQECANPTGPGGTATDCLPATSVGYQSGTGGFQAPTTNSAGSGATNGIFYTVDINGDGLQDLVFATNSGSNYKWWVQFASASGYGEPVNTGAVTSGTTDFLVDNFGGSQAAQILAPVSGIWYSYTWNGTSFTAASTGIAVVSGASYSSADVDGDGLPDLVSVTASTTAGAVNVGVQRNTGKGVGISFATTPTVNTVNFISLAGIPLSIGNVWGNYQFPNSSVKHLDFDGDGRQDILLEATFQGGYYVVPLLSRGIQAPVVGAGLASSAHPTAILPANWNDDACTDLVLSTTLLISPCNGTAQTQVTLPYAPGIALDWDGDGRTDLLANVNSVWELYRSEGTTFAQGVSTGIGVGVGFFAVGDVNGDGLDDLMFANCSSSCAIDYGLHSGVGIKPDLATSFEDAYGNTVQPSYVTLAQGGIYAEDPYWASPPMPSYPDILYNGPLEVVSQAKFSDPSGQIANYTLSYYYYEGWLNLQGRGFEGYFSVRTGDSRYSGSTILAHYQYYNQPFPYTGMPSMDISTTGVFYPTEILYTPNSTTLDSTQYNSRVFPYLSEIVQKQSEVGGSENGDLIKTTTTNLSYDNYGNATTISTTVQDNDPATTNPVYTGDTWTTTVTNTTDISTNNSADVAAWCLNLIDKTQVVYSSTINGNNTITRTKQFSPDPVRANCRLLSITTEPNNTQYQVTDTLTYDSFGNVATDTVTGVDMPSSPASRETKMNWGTTGQFLNTLTDPLGAVTTWSYSSYNSVGYGVPDSVKNPNNLTTLWSYDDFGRKTKETRPDGTLTTWAWTSCATNCNWSTSKYQVAQTAYQTNGTTVIRTDTSLFDPIDRVTQIAGPIVTGTTGVVQTLYDSFGNTIQQSLPFLTGATAYQQTFTYDLLQRRLAATRPISSTNSNPQSTTYAYAGRQLTTTYPAVNGNTNTKTIVTDVTGRLRQTTDSIGYTITRSYDAAGDLTGVSDNVGNTALWSGTYAASGVRPYLVASTDMDRGSWSFAVDSLGEQIGWTDANSHNFSMTYDALSRPLTRTEPIVMPSDPGLFTQWQYGSTPASDNVGQLISQCTVTGNPLSCGNSPQYSESRTFDALGRLATRAISEHGNAGNDGNGVLLFTYGYSSTTGLPSSLTYPKSTSGVALNLQYGFQYGLLQSVSDTTDTTATCGSTCTLWTANSMNAFGQVTKETLGNGVVTNRTFDAVTSWLVAATAGVGGGATLLSQSYLQDENGNLTQRQNNILSLTESFTYDGDSRLTCATLSGTSCSTPTFVYDGGNAGPGNITSQAGVGTYAYPSAGSPQPHAVTSITGSFNGISNPAFSYDTNGNMIARAGSTISWFSYNYPASISATDPTGSETVQFDYGPDRARWNQSYSGPTGTENTYYVGGQMETVYSGGVTNYRHYIYAGAEPIAVYRRTSSGGIVMSYFLEDHEGSVASILANSGAADVTQSYSAFGQMRDSQTWSGAPTSAQLNSLFSYTRQAYTFQTALGETMGLNHMNGRVQDSISGRMLSADPTVPDPSNSQSYNRYSYVNNNPLTFTDPSGFSFWDFLNPFSNSNPLNPFSSNNPLNPFGKVGRAVAALPFTSQFAVAQFGQRQVDSVLRDDPWLQPIAEIAACYYGGPWACAGANAYLTRLNGGSVDQALIAGATSYAYLEGTDYVDSLGLEEWANVPLKGVISGAVAAANGGSFKIGFFYGAGAEGAYAAYASLTYYTNPTWAPGGDAVNKDPTSADYEPAGPTSNNVGIATTNAAAQAGQVWPLTEGSVLSNFLNQILGFNSFATLHDYLDLTGVLTVPSMIPALIINYAALSGTIPLCATGPGGPCR
jgi:RHS repeat-associated protein